MIRLQSCSVPQVQALYLALSSNSTASGSGGTSYCWRCLVCSSVCRRAPAVTEVASVF